MARNKEPIKLTKEEFSKWYDMVNNWLVNVAYYFEKDSPNIMKMVNDKNKRETYVTEKIRKCEKGWNNNPIEFKTRIKNVFGFDVMKPSHWYSKDKKRWQNVDDLKTGKIKTTKEKQEALEILTAGNEISEMKDIFEEIIDSNQFELTEDEIKKTYNRIKQLYSTFQFNEANDRDSIKLYCLENTRLDRLYSEFLKPKLANYSSGMNNAIKDSQKMIRDLQELLGISAKNRREHESKEMTIEDLVAEFNADVADYQKTTEYALEEFIVIVRAYQAGKIHPNVIKYVYGVTLDEIFEAIDAHYTILDDDGKPMKPKDFQKYIDIKASNLCRKNLSDYGLNMEEKN